MRLRVREACAVGLAWGLSGCVLITGSTSGYQPADDAGSGGAGCAGDATCIEIGCRSAANCTGEAGGEVCCLMSSSSAGTSATAACSSQPCAGVQLCQTTAECSTGVQCVAQTCTFGAVTFTNSQACGSLPTCSAQ
jgi:hypothetical protein